MAAPVIVLMGPTGSGKGTQCELLAKHLGGAHISSGQLMRDDNNPEIIRAVNAGELAPSSYMEGLVEKAINKVSDEHAIILDGFPRRISDAHWLEKNLPVMGRKLTHVILLTATKAEVIKRISKRGRADDSEAALEEKWQWYKTVTIPVVDHFRKQGLVKEVDGIGAVEEVAKRIQAAL